jgi:hypothetical protein
MAQDRGADQKGQRLTTVENLQLENQFNVTAFPVFLLFASDGTLIDRIDGFDWRQDEHADKYFAGLEAAIQRGKAQAPATPADATGTTGKSAGLFPAARNPASSVRIYQGVVKFNFADHTNLTSYRTIEVTGDPAAMKLDCSDYYGGDSLSTYSSKVLMTGVMRGNSFYSTDQQCIKTDLKRWIPENIKIDFSADGSTAVLTSTYQNNAGEASGSGVLSLKH